MSNCLYRAHSLIENFHGLALARVFWIPLRAERLRSGPMNTLIADHENFSTIELSTAKGYIDEFFTLPEANRLKEALNVRQGYPLNLMKCPLPMNCRDENGRVLKPLRVLPGSTWQGSTLIPHRGNLELPFDVLALWRDENPTTQGGRK